MSNLHKRARESPYSDTKDVMRTCVPDDRVPWSVDWKDYQPVEYTASIVLKNPPWADNVDPSTIENFNKFSNQVDRTSFTGDYGIDAKTNRPKNPSGRTGLSGRGLLGRWGPNHAGDPVVTRWAKPLPGDHGRVLEIVLINRRDTGELALPGGMVDPGEHVSIAIKREFIEEAMNSNPEGEEHIKALFNKAESIFQGYIDDPRNTDNAWMESEAVNVHDEIGELTKDLKLEAGDDAAKVKWYRLDQNLNLYASHETIVRKVIEKHGAYKYWEDK